MKNITQDYDVGQYQHLLATRIQNVPVSFIREILKVTKQPEIISFAGGLPNADLFPVVELQAASSKILSDQAKQTLQYASTEGDHLLREWIAARYQQQGLQISPDNILISNGSQQALDLLGKVFINNGDAVIMENPGYLGAIQSLSLYQPAFQAVDVDDNGMDAELLQSVLSSQQVKLIYTVPNFQNPTGISYSNQNRREISKIVQQHDALLIEDNPYGELRFSGEQKTSFFELLPDQTILLGSFSKTVVPSFRLGWIVAPPALIKPLTIAKQAADLHTNYFTQRVMHQYLVDNDYQQHIDKIVQHYAAQMHAMLDAIDEFFPENIHITRPEGGMFLWVTVPEQLNAMVLFETAIKEQVAFVPGSPFYVDKVENNTLRLSFVTSSKPQIRAGIERLAKSIKQMLN